MKQRITLVTQQIALVLSLVLGCVSAFATVPIQGPTTPVCKGSWPVALVAPTGFATYRWSTGEITGTIFITGPGTYSVYVQRTNGQLDTGSIIVREASLPKPVISNGRIEYICRGETVSLKAPPGFRAYAWSTGAFTQTIVIDTAGFYRLTVTDHNGCVGSSDSLEVILFDRPKPTIRGPYTLCNGATAIYETDTVKGAIYTWNVVGGQLLSGQGRPDVRVRWPGGNGTVELRVSIPRPDGGSCDTLVRYQVRVGAKLQPSLNFQRRMFCLGDSTTLDAGAGFLRYRWSNGDTTQIIVVKTPGKYWVDVQDVLCSGASDSVTVIVFPPPDVRIAGDTSLCDGEQAVLSAFAVGNDVIAWQWSTGHAQRSIFVDTPGVYTVVGRTVNGCTDSATITVYAAGKASITAPDSLDYDSLELGTGRFMPFLLKNRTQQQITVLRARLASGRLNPALDVPTLPKTIAAQGDLAFVLTWLADIEGQMTDTLLIDIDGPECPSTIRIPLKGYAFMRPRVPVSITIGDTVVPVGTVLDMPIHIRATTNRDEFVTLEFTVRWNDRVFHVTRLDAASIISDQTIGAERTVRYRLSAVRLPLDTSLSLHGTVLLGSPLETDLIPESVTITGTGRSVYLVTTDPGHIAMTGCYIASRLVLFNNAKPLTVITNMVGEVVSTDFDMLPSGAYMVTTFYGTTMHTERILITR